MVITTYIRGTLSLSDMATLLRVALRVRPWHPHYVKSETPGLVERFRKRTSVEIEIQLVVGIDARVEVVRLLTIRTIRDDRDLAVSGDFTWIVQSAGVAA